MFIKPLSILLEYVHLFTLRMNSVTLEKNTTTILTAHLCLLSYLHCVRIHSHPNTVSTRAGWNILLPWTWCEYDLRFWILYIFNNVNAVFLNLIISVFYLFCLCVHILSKYH